jgi:hypothetical protein
MRVSLDFWVVTALAVYILVFLALDVYGAWRIHHDACSAVGTGLVVGASMMLVWAGVAIFALYLANMLTVG